MELYFLCILLFTAENGKNKNVFGVIATVRKQC